MPKKSCIHKDTAPLPLRHALCNHASSASIQCVTVAQRAAGDSARGPGHAAVSGGCAPLLHHSPVHGGGGAHTAGKLN